MRTFGIIITFVTLIAAATTCSVLQRPATGDDVLFAVDGVPVTVDEFRYVYEKNNFDNDSLYTKSDVINYLDMFIRFKLKVHEAKQLGYDTAKAFVEEYETYRMQLAEPLLTETKFQDQLIEEAYDRMKQEVRASHILIRLPKNATPEDTTRAYRRIAEIREQAISGADFATLAREYSEDPSARSNSGDLGYFSAFQMVYPFESAAYSTAVGKISGIVRSAFGYHIVKVTDKRPSPGKVKVAHILLRVKPDRSDSATVAEKAFGLHDQLMAGADWDALCASHSEDNRTRNNGGALPYLTHGQIDPSFMDMAFSITEPGGISDPFMTRYGWHILKLEDRRGVGSLEEMRSEIEAKVRRDERTVVGRSKLVAQLSTKLSLQVHEEALDHVLSTADSTLLKGKWQFDPRQSSLDDTLFHTSSAAYPMRHFLEYAQQNQRSRRNIAPRDYMRALYEDYLYETLVEDEITQLTVRDRDFRLLLQEYYEGILLFNIMEDKVWSQAIADSTGLATFFEQHRDDYTWDQRVRATVYASTSPEVLDSIDSHYLKKDTIALKTAYILNESDAGEMLKGVFLQVQEVEDVWYLIATGHDGARYSVLEDHLVDMGVERNRIGQIVKSPARGIAEIRVVSTSKKSLEWIFNRESPLTLEVRQGLFEKGDEALPGGTPWMQGSHRLSDGEYQYLVVVQEVLAPAYKAFDEVKGSVISAYQDTLEQEWLEDLRARYPVEMHKKVLQKLY